MSIETNDIVEELRPYHDANALEPILNQLYHNAHRTIEGVYLFQHFDEYERQLRSDNPKDKKSVFWNSSYYERMIDYVKISVAFENYNKGILLENGILVHLLKRDRENKELCKLQDQGTPIQMEEFKAVSSLVKKGRLGNYCFEGLRPGIPTISYKLTLSDAYQDIIQLDKELLFRLKEMNIQRNRLHFFLDFKGAFNHETHLAQWRYIREVALATIREKAQAHARKGASK